MVVAVGLSLASAAPARALITPPVTVDGPPSAIIEFGGVAMASDGSGGLVYAKAVDGVPHVFASRFVGGRWSAPVRVDWDQPFAASQPRVAAGPKGSLLVVWVTQVATIHGEIQHGLFSAKIGAGSAGFGPSLAVDGNVGDGIGVDPSIVGTLPNKAIVAYRVITHDFGPDAPISSAVQLRPGDVMADIRVARLRSDRWSRTGAVNRNPETSMRPPSPVNGPQVDIAADGSAAVAWQEPDQSGVARIWLRRVFGATPGPVLEASPSSWQGGNVRADADALSIAVSEFAQVRVAFRIATAAGSALSGRLLLNSLPSSDSLVGGTLSGAVLVDGAAGDPGPPDVAVSEEGGSEGSMRLGYLARAQPEQIGLDAEGALVEVPSPGPSGTPGAAAVVAVDPQGGGTIAYPVRDAAGRESVAVRQDFDSGAVQSAQVSGALSGPVSGLAIGRSGLGDALIAFRQGEPGRYQIVAERIASRPAPFRVLTPTRWRKPRGVRLWWDHAATGVGGVSYAVLIDGRRVRSGLSKRYVRLRPGQLGNGVRRVQVLATDALGQSQLSPVARLRLDGQQPLVRVRLRRRKLAVRIRDADAGLRKKATLIAFGDGARARRRSQARHRFDAPGRYLVVVRARDKVGNRIVRRFQVRVR
jgi:hypothetical protein